ncbi:helix-turn-helix domain-containing protein [Paenibacillus sp. Pae108]|uniref:helix-turn-helix domain-containing protein n=1 Tax=Paenibacillus sp. Pae108 TaxID=2926019 RepID=UPI0021176182|nr:helix-turn-helix transcriptional regulator [Paenibacillus sp. Pae108]
MKIFGEILRELRTKRNISQPELADALGINNRVSISNYENGKAEPKYEDLLKIAEYFNVTVDYLLGRENAEKYYFDKTKTVPEEEKKIENFLKETEALIREKSNMSEEELKHIKTFMEFIVRKKD